MDYSPAFIVRAAQAAQDERRADDWARLPIGERVLLIYRQMQRLDAAGHPADPAPLVPAAPRPDAAAPRIGARAA
jgi:hypothetical protein